MFPFHILLFLSSFALYDYNGILGTGQSLSVGVMAAGNYTNTQPFNNLKISLGSKESTWPLNPTDSGFTLVPLTEPLRPVASQFSITSPYPTNIYGESPHSAMANHLTSLNSGFLSVHTSVGESGQAMDKIRKGANDDGNSGRAYNASLFEIQAITNLAKKAGKSYGINAIIFTHGETDNASPTYQKEIVQLFNNYTTDIKSITGQTEDPIFILSQQHSFGDGAIPKSTMAAWKVMDDAPGVIFCSGPKYQYAHSSEGIHLVSQGYVQLGEKYAEVYNEVVIKGNKKWRPLEPVTATRVGGNTVNVTFNVPNPPLQWDTTLPSPAAKSQWRNGRGFELSSNGNAIEISSAEISGSSVLIIATQNLPSGSLKAGYAATSQTARANGCIRWGLLKDSDAMAGYKSKTAQPNWAVSFEIDVQ